MEPDQRLNTLCSGREIHQLMSHPDEDLNHSQEAENSIEELPSRSKRSADYHRRRHDDYQQPQSTSSSAWAKATLESAEARVNGDGFAQAYSQLGEGQESSYPSSSNRRLEATSASGSFRPPSRSFGSNGDQQRNRQQQAAHFSLQYQSPEKGVGGMPAFPASSLPLMATGTRGFMAAPSERSGLSSSFSSSSSYSSSSSLGAADLQAMMNTGRIPTGNNKGPGAPAAWTGPIPRDAVVTQTAGSSHKTYTWKVTDASGYTTTHWYSGPLGPDRIPIRVQVPQELNLPTPTSLGRRPITSWTGPIPMDATVTQSAGSSYKTYTWKMTDENGYTTTHWYSGPLGPDRTPIRINLDSLHDVEVPAPLPQQPQTLPAHQRRVSESRLIQQQQQQTIVQQQQQQQQQRHHRVKGQQQQPRPQQPQQEVHHMVGQVEQQQPSQQQQVQMQHTQFASTSESVQRISQPQQQQQQQLLEMRQQQEIRQQQEQQRRAAALEERERQRQREEEQQRQEEQRRLAIEERERLVQQRLREQQLREQQQREQQQREQQLREQQQREREQREQQLREQQLREQQLREQQLREQQQREAERRAAQEEEERQLQRTREMQQREQQRRAALEEHERQQQLLQRQREQQQYLRPTSQATTSEVHQQQSIHHQSSIKAAQPAVHQPATYYKRQPAVPRENHHQSVVEEQQHYTHRQQQQRQEEARSEQSSYHQEYQQRQQQPQQTVATHEEEHHQQQQSSAQEAHHVMEESTMLHIMEQQHQQQLSAGEGRRPLPVPSRPNQVVQEQTAHHQVIDII